MEELMVSLAADTTRCEISMQGTPLDIAAEATKRIDAHIVPELHKRLAELVKLPAFAKLLRHRAKRTETVARLEELNARIAEAKTGCLGADVASDAQVSAAVDRIAECERERAACELQLESIDRLLPDATTEAHAALRPAARKAMTDAAHEARQEQIEIGRTLWKKCAAELIALGVAQGKQNHAQEKVHYKLEVIADLAREHGLLSESESTQGTTASD